MYIGYGDIYLVIKDTIFCTYTVAFRVSHFFVGWSEFTRLSAAATTAERLYFFIWC